jgi:hypothetical protein
MTIPRTIRAIGVAVVAGGRAVDLALVETDGGSYVRLVETERQPLLSGDVLAGVVHLTRVFLGDRTLQPFAIDALALAAETADVSAAGLAAGVETDHCVVPDIANETRGTTQAARAAYAAVAALVAAG